MHRAESRCALKSDGEPSRQPSRAEPSRVEPNRDESRRVAARRTPVYKACGQFASVLDTIRVGLYSIGEYLDSSLL